MFGWLIFNLNRETTINDCKMVHDTHLLRFNRSGQVFIHTLSKLIERPIVNATFISSKIYEVK